MLWTIWHNGKPAKVRFSGMLRVVGNRINAVSDTLLRKETARKKLGCRRFS